MSYWVYLKNNSGELVSVESHTEGGTYSVAGSSEAELNVTYNYARFYHRDETLDGCSGLRVLSGMPGSSARFFLKRAIVVLGTEQDDDYWAATPGNAGYALSILLKWAELHPKAIFQVR